MTQAVAAHQFALGALDAVAPMHLLFERLRLHFLAAGLQERVKFAHHEGAMVLTGADTLIAQRARPARPLTPFDAVVHLAGLLLLQAADIAAALTGRTESNAFLDLNLEGFHGEHLATVGRGRRRAAQLSPFGPRLRERFAANIGPVHIKGGRGFKSHVFLLAQHLRQAGLVAGVGVLRENGREEVGGGLAPFPELLLLHGFGHLHFITNPTLVFGRGLGTPLRFGFMGIMHRAGALRCLFVKG